jgi:hypothetical protein
LNISDRKVYFSDGTWSDGIVSAAKEVGVSAKELFQLGQKDLNDSDHLLAMINTAQHIVAFTVQILTASSVHNSSSSKSQLILNSTGKQLMSVNEKLVKLCQDHISQEKIEEFSSSKSQTTRNAEEMEAKLNILKLEKELDRARIRLGTIRKVRYSMSGTPVIKIASERNQNMQANLGAIDEETMNSVMSRASVLEMVNNLDKSPDFLKPGLSFPGSKMANPKTHTTFSSASPSRRDFSVSAPRFSLSENSQVSPVLKEVKEEDTF